MAKTFLGKPVPNTKTTFEKTSVPRPLSQVLLLILAPLALAVSILFLLFTDFVQAPRTNPSSTPPISQYYQGGRVLAAVKATKTTALANQACNISPYPGKPNYLDASKIFPIIPAELKAPETEAEVATHCAPAFWNLDVARYFIYKTLTLVNWLAGALAIILTVIAGLYYISGFANEANVKKGKTILISAYVGLVIVIMARILIYGSVQIFSNDSNYDPGVVPNHSTDFIQK